MQSQVVKVNFQVKVIKWIETVALNLRGQMQGKAIEANSRGIMMMLRNAKASKFTCVTCSHCSLNCKVWNGNG